MFGKQVCTGGKVIIPCYKDYKIFMGKDDGKRIMETLFEGG